MEVWIPKEYPKSAPIMFVRPTSEMMVSRGNYVDGSGRCYHPYLAGWGNNVSNSSNSASDGNGNSENWSIAELLRLMSIAFGKEPPVYARPPEYKAAVTQNQPYQGQNQNQPPVPITTHPSNNRQNPPQLPPHPLNSNNAQPSQANQINHPATPTNRSFTQNMGPSPSSLTPVHTGQSQTSVHLQNPPHFQNIQTFHSQTPPPLPPVPGSIHHPLSNQNTGSSIRAQQSYQANPMNPPPIPYNQLTKPLTAQLSGPQILGNPQTAARPKPIDIMDLPDSNSTSNTCSDNPSSSASSDPNSNNPSVPHPPKLPPNPQKQHAIASLQTALQSLSSQAIQPSVHHNDLRLLQTHETLNWMAVQVRTELAELDRIKMASEENVRILEERIGQAEGLIAQLNSKGTANNSKTTATDGDNGTGDGNGDGSAANDKLPPIDDIVCAQTLVHTQLYDLVSEISAIEDTIYVLSKALDKGRIPLDVFLKNVRGLAREQFMKKKLVEKVVGVLGLDKEVYV